MLSPEEGIDAEVQYAPNHARPSCKIVDYKRKRIIEVTADQQPSSTPAGPSTEAATSMLLYTSGSTGRPKGIVISYVNQNAALESIVQYLNLQKHSKILNALSPAFDYGLYQYLIALAISGSIDVCNDTVLLDDIIDQLAMEDIQVFPTVPTTVRRLRSVLQGQERTFPEVSVVTSTGSVLDPESSFFLKRTFPAARIYSMYGLTECKRVSYLDPDLLTKKGRSVGRAMPNCEVWVLDDDGNEVRPGAAGQLFVSGPNVANAYRGDRIH